MLFLYIWLDISLILCYTLYSKNKGETKKMKVAKPIEITDNDKRFVYLVIIEIKICLSCYYRNVEEIYA